MISVSYLAAAEREFVEAARWYEDRAGLGDDFIAEHDAALLHVRKSPLSPATLDGVHRVARLRRYPYSLIYRIEDDTIFVVAVAHQSRRPGYWRRRG